MKYSLYKETNISLFANFILNGFILLKEDWIFT